MKVRFISKITVKSINNLHLRTLVIIDINTAVLIGLLDTDKLLFEGESETILMAFSNAAE